jgi:hypothetical protein
MRADLRRRPDTVRWQPVMKSWNDFVTKGVQRAG